MNGAVRRWTAPDDPCPGPTVDVAVASVRGGARGIATLACAVAAAVVVFLGCLVLLDRFALAYLIAPVSPWMVGLALGLAAAFSIVAAATRGEALSKWRTMVRVRAEWEPRWTMAKLDPAPRLVDHQEVGSVQIDTFDAHPTIGAAAVFPLADKITATIGTGVRVAVLETQNLDSQGQPVEGTRHPLRFRIVTFVADDMPDPLSTSTDPALVQLLAECAMSWTVAATGIGRWLLTGIDPLHKPDGETAAWALHFVQPEGPDMKYFREACKDTFAGFFGAETLVEHRDASPHRGVYAGDLLSGGTAFADPRLSEALQNISIHDVWAGRWSNILKMGAVQPRPEHAVFAEAQVGVVTLHRQPFVVQQGIDPLEFFKLEPKISTTLSASPFVSVTGFPGQGQRPGERHAQAFAITWADGPVPANPDKLAPERGEGPKWVLAGRINEAFDTARLARPEVVQVRALTDAKSRGHIWEIKLRLHGGVTLAEVRAAAQKIRQHLGSEWLRVAQSADGCSIVAGVDPKDSRRVVWARPEKGNRDLCTALDWEQAFADAKVVGQAGVLPKLTATGHLPANEQVQVLDFTLPPGTSRGLVRESVPKLQAATSNAFVEVRESPNGAGAFRLLVSEVNPLPERAPLNWDAIDAAGGKIPFATGIEGEPVVFDPVDNPHSLLAGVTGAGKSVLAQVFIYGALVHGADLYVIDPVKAGADFMFARDHARAFAQTPQEAQAVMKAVYEQVKQRKSVNAAHGVGSFIDLPEEVRPPRIFVMIDEFTSLMGQDQVPPQSDDPEAELERDAILASNRAKVDVGVIAGKIAREARSAGVHLLLGTQKLSAKMLDTIPGASDLKTNLARTLLGKTSSGDRMSALRAFQDAPDLDGDIPKGRGLYEPLTSTAVAVQVWFAPQDQLRENLVQRRAPLPEADRMDLTPFLPKTPQDQAPSRRPAAPGLPPVEVTVGEFEFSLDEFEDVADDVVPTTAPDHGPDSEEEEPMQARHTIVVAASIEAAGAYANAYDVVVPPQHNGESETGWPELDAVSAALRHRDDIDQIIWVTPDADTVDDLTGATYAELAAEVFEPRGIAVELIAEAPAAALDDVEPENAPADELLEVDTVPAPAPLPLPLPAPLPVSPEPTVEVAEAPAPAVEPADAMPSFDEPQRVATMFTDEF